MTTAFLSLFTQRFGSAFKKTGSANWRSMSQFHHLSDDEILAALQKNSDKVRACQLDAKTNFLLITVFETSNLHSSKDLARLTAFLSELNLTPRIYKEADSNAIQIYLPLASPVVTQKATSDLRLALEKRGFNTESGQLLVHCEEPFALPLQTGFCWLNTEFASKLSVDEIAAPSAVAVFVRDFESAKADTEVSMNKLQEVIQESIEEAAAPEAGGEISLEQNSLEISESPAFEGESELLSQISDETVQKILLSESSEQPSIEVYGPLSKSLEIQIVETESSILPIEDDFGDLEADSGNAEIQNESSRQVSISEISGETEILSQFEDKGPVISQLRSDACDDEIYQLETPEPELEKLLGGDGDQEKQVTNTLAPPVPTIIVCEGESDPALDQVDSVSVSEPVARPRKRAGPKADKPVFPSIDFVYGNNQLGKQLLLFPTNGKEETASLPGRRRKRESKPRSDLPEEASADAQSAQ